MEDPRITKMVNMIVSAYISVYGADKWHSLTTQQQHDAIMFIAKDVVENY